MAVKLQTARNQPAGLPVDARTPVWLLRRLLAEALQAGKVSLDEGQACMRALDGGDRQRAWKMCQGLSSGR